MNRTHTAELAPAVFDRLIDYVGPFRHHFHHHKQAAYCGAYFQGPLPDGASQSIELMARRVQLPEAVKVADLDQALQQFLGQRPWDDRAVMADYRSTMTQAFGSQKGIFVVDDTGLLKQGQRSVGVAHRYCGALGKKADRQAATALHSVGPTGHFPLAMRLHLPRKWAEDAERLERVGVPSEQRRLLTKGFGFLVLGRDREECGPALPGNRGPPPGDHLAGDPAGVAAAAGPTVLARLPLLPRPIFRHSGHSNGAGR